MIHGWCIFIHILTYSVQKYTPTFGNFTPFILYGGISSTSIVDYKYNSDSTLR